MNKRPERCPAKRRIRCPECGGAELALQESIVCFATFQQHADGSIDTEGWNSEGGYFRVDATCDSCKCTWRVRGAKQITDIRDDFSRQTGDPALNTDGKIRY